MSKLQGVSRFVTNSKTARKAGPSPPGPACGCRKNLSFQEECEQCGSKKQTFSLATPAMPSSSTSSSSFRPIIRPSKSSSSSSSTFLETSRASPSSLRTRRSSTPSRVSTLRQKLSLKGKRPETQEFDLETRLAAIEEHFPASEEGTAEKQETQETQETEETQEEFGVERGEDHEQEEVFEAQTTSDYTFTTTDQMKSDSPSFYAQETEEEFDHASEYENQSQETKTRVLPRSSFTSSSRSFPSQTMSKGAGTEIITEAAMALVKSLAKHHWEQLMSTEVSHHHTFSMWEKEVTDWKNTAVAEEKLMALKFFVKNFMNVIKSRTQSLVTQIQDGNFDPSSLGTGVTEDEKKAWNFVMKHWETVIAVGSPARKKLYDNWKLYLATRATSKKLQKVQDVYEALAFMKKQCKIFNYVWNMVEHEPIAIASSWVLYGSHTMATTPKK